jgi:putative peptidoglycan lipid II flippase
MTAQQSQVREATTGLIVRATALASALTVLGSVLGLLRDLQLARFFGATGQTDAFLVAWTVPEMASPLLIEGAMTFLMVPIFVRALAGPGGLGAVVRATLPRIAGLLTIAAVAVVLAAPLLVHLLAPGLAEPALAVRCMRVTAVTVLTFGLAGYLGAALRSTHIFGWPAAIYIAYNVGILGSIALLHQRLGVFAAAIGVAAGSVLMVAVQVPAFLRRLEPAALRGWARRPHVALIAFVPIAVYTVTRHAQVFVERILGSELSAGTISQLNYAQKVAQVPMVLSIMVATVTFPMLARSIATGDEARTRARLEWDLRLVSAVVLVASAYLVSFAEPMIRLLFEHGAFTGQDTSATAAIMRVYTFGLLGQAAVGVLTRSYFSPGRSMWYPALVMAAGLVTTAAISVVLLSVWHGMAIAAGNAAGITLTACLMLGGLRRRVLSISVTTVASAVARLAVLAALAGLSGWLVNRLMGGLPVLVTLLVGGLVVTAVFLLLAIATGVDETRPLTDLIRKRRRPAAPGALPMVLMYHSVTDADEDPNKVIVSPARFEEQLRWLERRGLRGTSMRELFNAAERGAARGLVGLTFDDGYADFRTNVVPALARHGFTATVYVIAGKLGGHNDWEHSGPVLPLMTADQVCQAARMGMEIGSHGLDHRRLAPVDAETLGAEVDDSREILESLTGAPVRGFCYPYGDVSDAAVHAARSAGYDYAVATRTTGRRDRYALPRTYVGERDGAARLYLKELRHRLTWRAGR